MTLDDLYALSDDGRRHELQAGCLISEPLPGFRHGSIAAVVAQLLQNHVRARGLGVVLANDAGYVLARSPDTARGPDVSFVRRERLDEIADPSKLFPGPPDLAVEVVSPSQGRAELHAKVADYLAAGTRLVWVIDPGSEQIAVYRSLLAPRILRPEDLLDGEDVVPGFQVSVREIFEI